MASWQERSEPGVLQCQPGPFDEAVVYIESSLGYTWTLETDANGFYQIWLDEANSLTIYATADEHTAGYATGVEIDPYGAVTTQNFDLLWLAPCINVTPASLSVEMLMGDDHHHLDDPGQHASRSGGLRDLGTSDRGARGEHSGSSHCEGPDSQAKQKPRINYRQIKRSPACWAAGLIPLDMSSVTRMKPMGLTMNGSRSPLRLAEAESHSECMGWTTATSGL